MLLFSLKSYILNSYRRMHQINIKCGILKEYYEYKVDKSIQPISFRGWTSQAELLPDSEDNNVKNEEK